MSDSKKIYKILKIAFQLSNFFSYKNIFVHSFNPLVPSVHEKVTDAGLFKYEWPFSRHQALNG